MASRATPLNPWPLDDMRTTWIVPVLLFALAACDHGRSGVIEIAKPQATALVSETFPLWLEYRDERLRDIPASRYPPSVKALHPKQVRATKQGLFIETYARYVESGGIFIKHDAEYDPPASGDPGFELVAQNVYWYFAPG